MSAKRVSHSDVTRDQARKYPELDGRRLGLAVVVVNHHCLSWTFAAAMLLLSMSTLAGAMVVLTLAAIFFPDPPCPLEEDRCGFAFCEVCMKEAPYACSACKTTRYCS